MRADLDAIAKRQQAFADLVDLNLGNRRFVIDYNAARFRLADNAWKQVVLPYAATHRELRAHVTTHLALAARQVGQDAAARALLFRGGAAALDAMAKTLLLQGKTGTVAALTIHDIMRAAAQEAIRQYEEDLTRSPHLHRIMEETWMELCELAVRGLYGNQYKAQLRRERLEVAKPYLAGLGLLLTCGVTILAAALF